MKKNTSLKTLSVFNIGCYHSHATSQISSISFEKEGLVYIPVKVAGEEKALTFVFDTGASTAVMDKAVVTRLRITTEDEVHSITGSRIQP